MTPNASASLLDLLGETRRRVVELLRGEARSVASLAGELSLTEVAVRHHLQALERDGLVSARTVRRDGRGRPGAVYELTPRARQLFANRSGELANELLEYLQKEHGRSELLAFLRWRSARQGERYERVLSGAGDTPAERATALAQLLSEDGFHADVEHVAVPDGTTVLTLTQGHCAIKEVAEAHPEICGFEAALFQRVLGARVSRRETIAGGAAACVCHVGEKISHESEGRADHGHAS